MIFVAVIVALGLLYAWIGARSAKLPLLPTMAAIALVNAQYLLVEQTIAGVAVRVVLVMLAAASLFVGQAAHIRIRSKELMVVILWCVYAGAIFVSGLVNSSISSVGDLVDFASRYGVAILAFLLVFRIAAMHGGSQVVAGWLFMIALANFVFAVAQLAGVDEAHDIHTALFPITAEQELLLQSEGLITTLGYTPGLSAFSIATGYVLACFGILGVGLAASRRTGYGRATLVALTTLIVIVGGMIILSRSTSIIGAIVLLGLLLVLQRPKYKVVSALIVLVMLLLAAALGSSPEFLTELIPGSARLFVIEDSARVETLGLAMEVINQSPIFGGFREALETGAMTMGAHNFVVNALLYFGVVGFVPMAALVAYSLYAATAALKSVSRIRREKAIVAAAYAGMLCYLGKSLLHNESIVTSGIQFSILLAIVLGAARATTSSTNRSFSSPPTQPGPFSPRIRLHQPTR